MSKSIGARLYDAFTASGRLASSWDAAGLKTTYDEDEKTLSFELPEGWIGTMSSADRARRAAEWCIDDPTHDVTYVMKIRANDREFDVTLLHKPERDDGTFEPFTGDDGEWTREVVPGARVFVEVGALAKLVKGKTRELPLFEGNFVVPETYARDVGGGRPGYFFVVDGGFAFVVVVGDDGKTPRRATFVGKLVNLENDVV